MKFSTPCFSTSELSSLTFKNNVIFYPFKIAFKQTDGEHSNKQASQQKDRHLYKNKLKTYFMKHKNDIMINTVSIILKSNLVHLPSERDKGDHPLMAAYTQSNG